MINGVEMKNDLYSFHAEVMKFYHLWKISYIDKISKVKNYSNERLGGTIKPNMIQNTLG